MNRVLALASLSLLIPGCFGSGGGGGECAEGSEACACYGNGTCDDGLSCRSGVCVSGEGEGTTTAGGGGGPSGGSNSPSSGSGPGDDSGLDDGSSGGPSGGGGETGGGSDSDTGATAGGEPGGPEILSLSSNLQTITRGDTLIISAIVTDPDGIDDVIGGQLQTTDGSAVFGTFGTSAEEGAYSLSLAFGDFFDVEPAGTEVSPVERTVRAEFFDQSGATGWATLTFTLDCETALICGSGCVNVECYPGVLPCGAGFTCQSGTCVASGDGQYGDPCEVESDCETMCAPFDLFADGECSSPWCCAGSFCEPGNDDCGSGTFCAEFWSEAGGSACALEATGVCLADSF